MPSSWDHNSGVHSQLLKPLLKHKHNLLERKNAKFFFTNIQSLLTQTVHVPTPYEICIPRY